MQGMREINILLLGETGVGKSTFINAFANYLTYDTLDEAEKGRLICLIPTEFTVTDSDYNEKRVKIGHDKNEVNVPGKSATQQCRAYLFKYGDICVRLIDTPGVGDTSGIEQDKANFNDLVHFISHYRELHLICILLKPNNSRITVTFEFCVKQLLCHLQKDASKNMVFLFTNARGTFYRPGDTSSSLRSILNDIEERPPNVKIPMEKKTIYCLDNESFRFLVALTNNVIFDDDERDNFSQSWLKSVNECQRLMNYVIHGSDGKGMAPHRVQDTISINEARRLIIGLKQPIADIAAVIDGNIKKLENLQKEIKHFKGTIEELQKLIYVPEFEYTAINSVKEAYTGYLTPLRLVAIPVAAGVDGFRAIAHQFTYFSVPAVQKRNSLADKLKSCKNDKEAKENATIALGKEKDEYYEEQKVIIKASAKFASFLKKNAIIKYNDIYKEYLEQEIENQKTKNKDKNEMRQKVRSLEAIIEDYQKEIQILEDLFTSATDDKDMNVSAKDVIDEVKKLYELNLTGAKIKEMHEANKSDMMQYRQDRETVHTVSKKGFFKKIFSFGNN